MPPPFPPGPPGASPPFPPGRPGPPPPAVPPPMVQRPGRGVDPREAMMFGLGDMSYLGPPPAVPPPPGAPTGPDGLPIGGSPPSADPGMDPRMGGSSLFQALAAQLDPYASPPSGHGELGPPGDLDTLLAMLALREAGGASSGLTPSPTEPGLAMGLEPPLGRGGGGL